MEYFSFSTLCLCVFFTALISFNGCLGCQEEERLALLEYKTTQASSSDALLTWVDAKRSDCCAWERVKCNTATPRRVIHLNLSSTFTASLLNGSIFLHFQELQHLDLSYNFITDWQPNQGFEKLSGLKKLEVLNLGKNFFNSSVLPSLGAITSLKNLSLYYNNLGGSISENSQDVTSFSGLKKLEILNLNNCFVNNSIIPLFGPLTALKSLNLGENQLEGSLAEFSQVFANLSNLEVLDLSANTLNGFSAFRGSETMSRLKILNLSWNDFSGKVPTSIFSLSSLEALSLRTTNIKDFISDFCYLKNLQELDLKDNKFEGILPPCFGKLTSLRLIDFYQNELTGSIPFTLIYNLKSLQYLSLGRNHFQGAGSLTTFFNPKFQLRFLSLDNCALNISSSDLLKLLHNQYDLRHVDFPNNKMHGKFPIWLIQNNTRLSTLVLGNNLFDGVIHIPLNHGGNMHAIDISDNNIQGQIQTNIGDIFPELRFLNISRNKLDGKIPSSIGKMKKLLALDLSSNNLSGKLPSSLALNCKLLLKLILSNNRLQGQIPPAVFNLTYLSKLSLNNNRFTGNIPNGNFVFITLYTLDMRENNISGTIPRWISNLTVLSTLLLGNNFLVGPIPPQLCNLDNLDFLDLSLNHLSGPIPSCLLKLSGLRYLQLQGNKLNGSLPMVSPYYSSLQSLNLNHNQLSGRIPKWFGSLSLLRLLLIKGNRFNGSAPRELCQLNRISIMDLSHNLLSGFIPPCFSNITFGKTRGEEQALEVESWISVSTYEYTGLLGNIDTSSYAFLELYRYQVEIEFMSKYYKEESLNSMSGMDISWNRFTGGIPLQIGALSAIRALSFSHNQLTGKIPRSLSNLKQLESMDLSYNKLTGVIPSKLADIKKLLVFSVAYNSLSGQIPGQFQKFGTASYKGNPSLCGPPLQKKCK